MYILHSFWEKYYNNIIKCMQFHPDSSHAHVFQGRGIIVKARQLMLNLTSLRFLQLSSPGWCHCSRSRGFRCPPIQICPLTCSCVWRALATACGQSLSCVCRALATACGQCLHLRLWCFLVSVAVGVLGENTALAGEGCPSQCITPKSVPCST